MLKEKALKLYQEFISLKGSPEFIARSFSAGAVVGFCPFIGTHTVLCMAASILFRLNLTAMYIASWGICNPITTLPILIGDYELGRILLAWPPVELPAGHWTFSTVLNLGWGILLPMTVGWLVGGTIIAVLLYPLTRRLIVGVRRKRNPLP